MTDTTTKPRPLLSHTARTRILNAWQQAVRQKLDAGDPPAAERRARAAAEKKLRPLEAECERLGKALSAAHQKRYKARHALDQIGAKRRERDLKRSQYVHDVTRGEYAKFVTACDIADSPAVIEAAAKAYEAAVDAAIKRFNARGAS